MVIHVQAVVVLQHILSSALELHSEGHHSLLQEVSQNIYSFTPFGESPPYITFRGTAREQNARYNRKRQ